MSDRQQNSSAGEVAFISSIEDVRRRCQQQAGTFERWHFDALSDDGREALVIEFYDDHPFPPRSNGDRSVITERIPAVSLVYAVDGKAVFEAVSEFTPEQFSVDEKVVQCSIGNSCFEMETASYGSGFVLHIDLPTTRKRRLLAELEWLFVESDLTGPDDKADAVRYCRNLAVTRSDVSGRISLADKAGSIKSLVHFRGTGYHDHFRGDRSLVEAGSSCWGRGHFTDATAVFHCDDSGNDLSAKVFLVRDGTMHQRNVLVDQGLSRTRSGLKLGRRLILSDDEIKFNVEPLSALKAGLCQNRMLCEMTLKLRDGIPKKTIGITEVQTPRLLGSRLFKWIADLRTGKNGNGPVW